MEKIVSFFKSEPYSKEFTFGEFKVKLRTLSRAEFDDVMARADISVDNLISKDAIIKRSVLGYALISVNGSPITELPEIKLAITDYMKKYNQPSAPTHLLVEDALGNMDAGLVDVLYDFYKNLQEENQKRLDEIKKA